MTEQDFKDAYILLLSGAAKIVPGKGIEWKDEYGCLVYISFPDITDSSKAIVRCYWENKNKHWEEKYKNGLLHGKKTWLYTNGKKWHKQEYKNGKLHGNGFSWLKNGNKYREEVWGNDKLIRKFL